MQINNEHINHIVGFALWFRLGKYSVFHIETARVKRVTGLQPISGWILSGVAYKSVENKDSLVSEKKPRVIHNRFCVLSWLARVANNCHII